MKELADLGTLAVLTSAAVGAAVAGATTTSEAVGIEGTQFS